MTVREPMPPLCRHDDTSLCDEECEAKNKKFDDWVRRGLKEKGDGSVRPSGATDEGRPRGPYTSR